MAEESVNDKFKPIFKKYKKRDGPLDISCVIDFQNDGFAGHQQVGIIFLVNNSNYVDNSRNNVKK